MIVLSGCTLCVALDPASEPCHELPGRGRDGGSLWVAARSAAAHSRDLVCCVNHVYRYGGFNLRSLSPQFF